MKTIKLNKVEHNTTIGDKCPYYEPNIKEDCFLELDGEIIGFYISDISKYSKKLSLLLAVADKEFRSDNVPKSLMNSRLVTKGYDNKGKAIYQYNSRQYSTILGSVAPKAHLRRPYPTISSTHREKKAKTFIKAMLGSCLIGEEIIKKLTPKIYKRQKELFEDIKKDWRFGTMYTSSISNFNISADYHLDRNNIKETVNIIFTKRNNSKGGCLNVPDYNVTFEQSDNSMLVYPAWRNVHGVTPIQPTSPDGYRNSLIFYALKAFKGI